MQQSLGSYINGLRQKKGFTLRDVAKKVLSEHGRAKIITATNVFAHIEKNSAKRHGYQD